MTDYEKEEIKHLDVVQKAVLAIYGTDEHRDILVHVENPFVRFLVAKYGTDQHKNILVNDKDMAVRMTVARSGNMKHLVYLVDDKNEEIRKKAKERLDEIAKELEKKEETNE